MHVDDALLSRRSVRGFRPDPVPRASIEHILRVAARTPSGTNMQPWRAYVVVGAAKDALSAAVLAARAADPDGFQREWKYYPDQFREPYLGRRRKVGFDLYRHAGVAKGDKEGMFRQHGKNFTFFGAPVGIFFTIDKDLEIGSWLDHGMLLQSVMLAARGQGLHTCPQAAWPPFHQIIREHLDIPETESVVCGMAVGFEDESVPENALATMREPLERWTSFIGY